MQAAETTSSNPWRLILVAPAAITTQFKALLNTETCQLLNEFDQLPTAVEFSTEYSADAIICHESVFNGQEPRKWRHATGMLPLILVRDTTPSSKEAHKLLHSVDDYVSLADASPDSVVRTLHNAVNLQRLHLQFRKVLSESPDGVVVIDALGDVLYANTTAGLLFESTVEDMLASQFGVPIVVNASSEIDLPGGRTAEMRTVDIDWLGEAAFLASLRDITERKLAEAQLIRAAEHDSLTALPNRSHFQSELSKSIAWAGERQKRIAVFFLDLDNFKTVNDTMGHDAGDQLLRIVADRLLAACRNDTLVGRLGGDEFIALARDVDPGGEMVIAERFMQQLGKACVINEQQITISASIGVATYPESGKNAHAMITAADAAMYTAKQDGRNRIKLFSKEAGTAAARRKLLEKALSQALTRREMSMVYQPIYQIDTDPPVTTACEALLRWNSAGFGFVGPDEFIPLAESSGWIEAIGRWIVVEVCRQISEWNKQPDSANLPKCVSINVSSRQLKDVRFPDFISRVMRETNVQPRQIWIEITETGLMHNIDECIEVLTDLRKLGLKIAVDDFGTGYSSLAYLQRLPIDIVKIDRAFITGIGSADGDTTIVNSVMQIAKSLDLMVIGEGVECEMELQCLRQLECDLVQGYLLARPMAAADLTTHLSQ